jgi:TP901 family phage tail tape measure protein
VATTTVLYRLVGQDAGASRVFDRVGGSASAMDKVMRTAAYAGVAIAAALVKAADDATKFNTSMTKIQTQAGASAADVKVLSAAVLKLAPSTQQGPQQLSEALYHLKSVGMDNVDAMKALKTASDLASVGGADLEATTNALAGAWRTGIKGATDMGMAAGTLNAIIGAGNMKMEDLVAAIGTGILPSAKTFGLSLGQVGAALALMTDEGVPAVDAATRLRMSFSLLGAPSAAAEKWLKKIGLSGLQLGTAMRGPDGIIGAITLLKQHLDASGMSAVQQSQLLSHAFGGGKSSSAILALVNNLDVLRLKQNQVNSSTGKYGAAVVAQRATVEAQLKMLESAFQTASIQLGTVLLPPMLKAVQFINATLLPGIHTVTDTLRSLIPTAKIKSDLAGLTGDLGAFFRALNPSTPKAKVGSAQRVFGATVGAVTYPSAPRIFSGGGAAGPLAPAGSVFGPIAPGRVIPRMRAPDPFVWNAGGAPVSRLSGPVSPIAGSVPNLSAWTTGGNTVKGLSAGPLAPVGGVKLPPPPDVSGWAKVGTVIKGVADNLEKFAGQVGSAMGNLATAVGPTVQFLGTALGVTLLGALTTVSHILSAVVGPAFVEFTGFLSKHQGTVRFFAEVILGALLVKMTAIGALRVATGVTNLATSILTFPVNSVSSIGTAFDGLKTAGTNFKTAAVGIGSKVADLGRSFTAGAKSAKDIAGDLGALAQYGAAKTWDAIKSGASTVGGALSTAASNAKTFATNMGTAIASGAKSAWSGLVSGASAAATAVAGAAKATWDWVAAAAASTAAALKQAVVWTAQKVAMLASAVAEGIATAAQWLWNLAMTANPIGLVIVGITALVGAIIWVATKTTWFETAWKYTWGAISDAALTAWHFLDKWVIQPIAGAFSWLWTGAIEPALRFIVLGFLDMAGNVLKAAASMLGWVPGIGGELKGAVKQFQAFRDGVNAALGGIAPKTVPVTVSFNGVPQGQITGHTYTSTTGFSYARGGHIPEWLGTPNVDSVPILAMGGEYVVNKKSTAKHRKLLEAINSGDPKKYAQGGMVGFTQAASSDMSYANRLDIAATVKQIASAYAHAYNASTGPRGLAWARTQVGMPYQWGGDGNPSWDCSGFMSAIESVMRGESPHRRWATGAFSGNSAPPGWVQDAKAPFMIGITNAGVGHTAGTLMGVNVEMSVGGGKVGPGARGANDPLFPSHYGLVGFDQGGIARGVGMMPKMTHAPERVLSPRQTAAFEQLVAQLTAGAGGSAASFAKLGAAIPAGVASGVTGAADTAHAAVRALAKGSVDAFSAELGIASPSKKFATLGGYVMFGLVQGLTGSMASVKAASKRIATALFVDFGSGHKALQATVARDNATLLTLATRRDAVSARLKAANSQLAALQKSWAEEQKSVADSIMQSATVVTSAAAGGADQVVANFAAQTQKAIQFAALLHLAQAHGLNATMVAQIAASGVDSGFATAQALSTAGGDPIRQLNQMQGTMQAAANSVGGAVADSMYGAGIQASQGLVKGLQSQEKAIEAQMMRIALAMQTAIKKALGIRSPSTVAEKIGVFFPQGLGNGIVKGIPHAVAGVKAMSAAVAQAAQRSGMTPAPGAIKPSSQARMTESRVAASSGPTGGEFTGNLYLDSGVFLGIVRGEIKANDRDKAFRAKVGRS